MRVFKDTAGRTWTLTINVGAVKRVRDLLKIDLLDVGSTDEDVIAKLTGDPVALVDVLYVLCKPEADKLGIADEQFGSALGGDSLELATDAFVEELFDCFPQRKRQVLHEVLNAARKVQDKQLSLLEAKIKSGMLEDVVKEITSKMNSPEPTSTVLGN